MGGEILSETEDPNWPGDHLGTPVRNSHRNVLVSLIITNNIKLYQGATVIYI